MKNMMKPDEGLQLNDTVSPGDYTVYVRIAGDSPVRGENPGDSLVCVRTLIESTI